MRAGEGDVPADRATDDRDDGEDVQPTRGHRSQRRLGKRRMRRDGNVQGEPDHEEAEDLRKAVHRPAGFTRKKERHADDRAEERALERRDAEHRAHPESGAGNIADVECQTA